MSLLLRVVKYLGLAKHILGTCRGQTCNTLGPVISIFPRDVSLFNIFYRPSTTIDILSWECSMYELNRNVNN